MSDKWFAMMGFRAAVPVSWQGWIIMASDVLLMLAAAYFWTSATTVLGALLGVGIPLVVMIATNIYVILVLKK